MKRKMLISCMYVFFIMPVAAVTYGQTPYNISVTINGMAPPDPSIAGCNTPTTCVNIAGTYGNIVIEKISSSAAARVEVPSTTPDTSSDTLRLINARVRATAAAQTVTIVFKRQFTTPPQSSTATTYYKITANGTFSPEAGNAFTAKGLYTYPYNGTADQMGSDLTFTVICDQAGCTQSADKKTGEYYAPGAADRILQANFIVTLLQNGSSFSTGTGVKMAAPQLPEGGGDVCPECTPKAQLNAWCMTTYSTAKAFGCPSCVTEDGQVAEHAKVKLFASTNWDNLSQDMAQGQGEHLASLAALLNVPAEQQSAFFELAQETYRTSIEVEAPAQVVASLQERWITH